MAASHARNPNVPAVPAPTVGNTGLLPTVRALKEGIESLSGQRGAIFDRAVTFNDLVRMGLVTREAVASPTGTTTLGSGTTPRDYITPEDFGAIGDGTSRPAGTYLGLGTLAELQAYRGGIYSFADSLTNEMDWLGLQAALWHGGYIHGRASATYILNKTVTVPSGTVQFDGRDCTLSFRDLSEGSDDGSNLLTNPSFDDGATGWQNTSLSPRVDVVFSGGKASFTDPAVTFAPDETHFGQFGQQVTIPAGKWTVRARVKLSEGASQGYWGSRVLGMGFFKDGPGVGGWAWPDPLYPISSAGASVGAPYDDWIQFDIEAPEEITAWLTFSGFNCDWEVQEARIGPFLMNFAVWCTGDFVEFDSRYDETTLRNFTIIGPALETVEANDRGGTYNEYAGPLVSGFLHKSFKGESSRSNLVNVHIRNFYRGVWFSDQAFLNRHEQCTIGYCAECVYFQPAVRNAGENYRFTNCIIFNSGLGVNAAGGAEWNFMGCSIDYCRRLIHAARGAVINLHGHHFEFDGAETRLYLASLTTPFVEGETITGGTSGATATIIIEDRQEDTDPHLVVEVLSGEFVDGEALTGSSGGAGTVDGEIVWGDYLLDLSGGAIINLVSGEWLQSGFSHRGALHAARLTTTLDTIAFGDVWGYNWKTASGDWATGAGRIVFNNHLGPGNSLMPDMMLRNAHMDAFAGNGGIAGTGSWEDQGFTGPADGIGIDFSAHSDEVNPASSRSLVPWEQEIYAEPTVFRTTGKSSMALEINVAYTGGAELRVFVPVAAGKVVLPEFYYSKPTDKPARTLGPYVSGLPLVGDTIYVNTTDGRSIAIVEDKHAQWIGGSGPRAGWTVTLANVTGDPGGIANAVWNATHTVVERIDAYRFSIDLGSGNEATSSDSNAGGATIEATYSQTSVLIFVRNFWVRRTWFDSVGRPVLSQAQYQGESNVEVTLAAHDWTKWSYATWYTEPDTPDDLSERVARGRAPEWATHYMVVLNWQNIRECDLLDPPILYLTDFYANVL